MILTSVSSLVNILGKVKLALLSVVVCVGCAGMPFYEYPPPTPIPILPVSSSVIVNQTDTRFVWRETENAEHYDFHIFNRANSDISTYFLERIDPDEVCYQQLCEITLELLLPVRNGHAWRVRAGNIAGKSAWTRIEFEAAN